jgi:DNA-binding MarR family transcriptional regulator
MLLTSLDLSVDAHVDLLIVYTFIVTRKVQVDSPEAPRRLDPRSPAASDPDTATRLRTVVARLSRRLRRNAAGELTLTQLSALGTLYRRGPLRLNELARREGISASTISRLVDSLEQSGALVERSPDPTDARASQVAITAEGSAVLEDLRRNGTRLIDRALHSLDSSERAALHAALPALEKLVEWVEADDPDE